MRRTSIPVTAPPNSHDALKLCGGSQPSTVEILNSLIPS